MKRSLFFCLFCAGNCFSQTPVPTYTVNTFAGGAPMGDGGPAASGVLRWPAALRFDAAGNLYIADQGNAAVRKVTPDGFITTLAGTGEAGYSGDGGPASRAQLSSFLLGLALDSQGNIYISDVGNNAIRKVSAADGTISTYVYGPNLPQPVTGHTFRGIAIDGADNLYLGTAFLSTPSPHQIVKIAPDGAFSIFAGNGTAADNGDEGPATEASFNSAYDLYFDASGTLYFSDAAYGRIRKITPDGIIHAFAGNGTSGFSGDGGPATDARLNGPTCIGGDASGNLYFTDANNNRVRKVAADGTISTIGGGGGNSISGGDGGQATSTNVGFGGLHGLAVSAAGDVYVSDFDSGVRVITMADGMLNTAYGQLHFVNDGTLAENALFTQPLAFTSDAHGNFYLGDWYRVRKIDTNGVISTIAGTVSTITGRTTYVNNGDGGPATAAAVTKQYSLTVDAAGNIYFDSFGRVRRVGTDGIINTVAGGGTVEGDGGPATKALLSNPIHGLAIDSAGSLYIADTANHRIRKVTPDGTISTIAGTGTAGTSGDGGPATAANINLPYGLAFDAAGNLYFADPAAARVRKIAPDGTISTVAGNGTSAETGDGGPASAARLNGPQGLAIGPDGSLYIADGNTNPNNPSDALRVVTPDGIIHTIASSQPLTYSPYAAFGGDGGPAIGAVYNYITNVAFDGSSNIYVLDSANERIRVLTPNQ